MVHQRTVLEVQLKSGTLGELKPTLQRLASQRRVQRRSLLLDLAHNGSIGSSRSMSNGELASSEDEQRTQDRSTTRGEAKTVHERDEASS